MEYQRPVCPAHAALSVAALGDLTKRQIVLVYDMAKIRGPYDGHSTNSYHVNRRAFWSHVTKTDGCWYWKDRLVDRYGAFWVRGKLHRAHRVSYALAHGRCPTGWIVRHLCGQRNCVRPEHLRLGTCAENAKDAQLHGTIPAKATICKQCGAPRYPKTTSVLCQPCFVLYGKEASKKQIAREWAAKLKYRK